MIIRWPFIVITVCCLLAIAPSAAAERGWVVWAETTIERVLPDPAASGRRTSVSTTWTIYGTYPTDQACYAKQNFLWPSVAVERGPIVERGVVVGHTATNLHCLPNTVDQRESKGK